MNTSAIRRDGPLVLWLVVLAGLTLGPSLLQGGFVGHPGVDVWSHVWGMDWFADSLAHGRVPWRVDGLRHPDGGILWYIDLLGALWAAPAMAAGWHVLGYNSVLVVQVLLAGVGGAAWERSLGGSGFVASAALMTAPFLLCSWSNSVLEAGWLGFVALSAAAASQRSRLALLWVALACLASPYLGVSAVVTAGILLVLRRDYRLLAMVLATAALVAIPVVYGITAGFDDPRSMAIKPPPGPRWPTWRINGVDPRAFFLPGDFWSVDLQGDGAPPFKRTPYLGWVVGIAAGVAFVRKRLDVRLMAVVAFGMVIALGPILFWRGDFVQWPGSEQVVWLPFGWIWMATGVGMDHPLRFVVMAVVVLAGGAGAAVGRRRATGMVVGLLVVAEQLLVAPTVWPLPVASSELPAIYSALPDDSAAVVDLPADRGGTMHTSRYLYWHALHGRPIPYGNKVSGELLRVDNDALKRWTARSSRGPGVSVVAVRQLRGMGYGWVLVHESLCQGGVDTTCARLVERVSTDLGVPRRVEGGWIWALPETSSISGPQTSP